MEFFVAEAVIRNDQEILAKKQELKALRTVTQRHKKNCPIVFRQVALASPQRILRNFLLIETAVHSCKKRTVDGVLKNCDRDTIKILLIVESRFCNELCVLRFHLRFRHPRVESCNE